LAEKNLSRIISVEVRSSFGDTINMFRFIETFNQHYRPLEDVEEFDELKPRSEKERRYSDRSLGYRNAFFALLVVNVVAVLLWLSLVIDKRKGNASSLEALTVLGDCKL
jgi:hypothetical protein